MHKYRTDINILRSSMTVLLIMLFFLKFKGQDIYRTTCQGKLERLDSLLSDTSINQVDHRGRSLLHWAVACKQKEVFEWLISEGIDVQIEDAQGKTPLYVAVQFNNLEYINDLIDLQSSDEWSEKHGASLLELAVLNQNQEVIEVLLKEGVDIDCKNYRGSTALEIAERIGAKDISDYLSFKGADSTLIRKFEIVGNYMGQERPGQTPKMFAPSFISTEEQEFGSVFNANGTAFYFGVDVNGRNEIRFTEIQDNQWTKPVALISDDQYSYNDPFLSNDEDRLYFISNRALDGISEKKDIDIWFVEKTIDGWSKPINAGPSINTKGDEYYISFSQDGRIYFASDGLETNDSARISHDIYCSRFLNKEFQKPERLSSAINTEDYEADVFVSPDETYIIFCSTRDEGFGRGDLYISFKDENDQWRQAVNMGPKVNTKHYEYCPFVTKDGKYLFFTSNQDIYWVSAEIIGQLREKSR